ncbi:MAG: hypothetical protein KKF56_02640 [Nanoarchaeota archaeon]|nr:hypothetical protein [Nanoarchaeota archaeon]
MDKEKIRKEAKQVMDKFQKALDKAGIDEADVQIEREESVRDAKDDKFDSIDFKKRMLKNAPKHDDDCIVAERGDWV